MCDVTFALEALLPQDADEGQEPGDLLQVQHCGVVKLDDGQGLLIIRTAAPILLQPAHKHTYTHTNTTTHTHVHTHKTYSDELVLRVLCVCVWCVWCSEVWGVWGVVGGGVCVGLCVVGGGWRCEDGGGWGSGSGCVCVAV